MAKVSKRIDIKMSPKQLKDIKNWLSKNRIKLDGEIEFGLIAEPRMNDKSFCIKLLTRKQFYEVAHVLYTQGITYQPPQ